MSVLDGPGEVLGTITRKATDALTSPPAVELGTYALKVALQWAIPTAVIVIGVLAVSGGGDDDAKPSGSSSSGLAPKAKGLRKLFGLPAKESSCPNTRYKSAFARKTIARMASTSCMRHGYMSTALPMSSARLWSTWGRRGLSI